MNGIIIFFLSRSLHFPMIVQLRPSTEENISQARRKKKNNKASKRRFLSYPQFILEQQKKENAGVVRGFVVAGEWCW